MALGLRISPSLSLLRKNSKLPALQRDWRGARSATATADTRVLALADQVSILYALRKSASQPRRYTHTRGVGGDGGRAESESRCCCCGGGTHTQSFREERAAACSIPADDELSVREESCPCCPPVLLAVPRAQRRPGQSAAGAARPLVDDKRPIRTRASSDNNEPPSLQVVAHARPPS